MTRSNSSDLANLSMMELFRMEAANMTDDMTSALIDLESHPDTPTHLEMLMRGAHSLKGAARIVGVEPLVALGHAMEDRLTAAQGPGAPPLARHHVDALLQGTALFADIVKTSDAAMPAWLARQHDPIERLMARLTREERPADTDVPATGGVPVPTAPVRTDAAAPASPALAGDATPVARESNRQLRLEAGQLEALLGLAREALLVNRAQERQSLRLERLRKDHRKVSSALDRLHEAHRSGQGADVLRQLLESVTSLHEQCGTRLQAHLEDHAGQTRRGHRISTRLHHTINSTRMTRFASAAAPLKRLARDTGQRVNKDVVLVVEGSGTQIDRDVLDRIEAPLAHLVRNAIDHGIEDAPQRQATGKSASAKVTVMARHHGGQLEVTVRDDGRGVDLPKLRERVARAGLSTPDMLARMSEQELLAFLFLPGFSTRDTVTETSGRGVGLDVVQSCVQALRGRLRIDNVAGSSLAITMVLPVSLSLVRALTVEVGGEIYALPLSRLERIVSVPASSSRSVMGQACVDIDGHDVAWAHLGTLLGAAPPPPSPLLTLIEISTTNGRIALSVDRLLGERDLALQALDARLPKPEHISSAAVLDDGTPVLVLEVAGIEASVQGLGAGMATLPGAEDPDASAAPSRRRILVVEDSFTVREVERKVLAGNGYEVDVAVDGVEGWNALSRRYYDLVLTDVDMPRMNGLELLRRIRASDTLHALPVMIVSYKDREEDRMAGLTMGANRYFVKSGFEEAALLEAVADLIA